MKNTISKLLLLLLLVASAFAIAQEKDWIKATTKDGAITFQVPPGYFMNDPNDPVAKARTEQIIKDNAKLAKMVTSPASDDQTLQMYDLNDSPDDGVLDGFNVLTVKNPGLENKHLGEVGKQTVAGLPMVGKGEYKVVDFPAGKAVSYWGTIEIKLPEGETKRMDLLGYVLLKGDKMHVVSFATAAGTLKEKKPLFEKIMKSAKL